jgi:hypothetical protein
MTTNYEQSRAYVEDGQYARAQTSALLAIADRLENVGGAIIHLIPMPDVQGPFSDDFNEDEMEAAYLRAGLEKLLETFLSSTLTGIQRWHVQSVLNHTWTPA